ncbi:MAG: hypothetical protein CMP23_10105 [Rickettsiales bacterium]|mgnify:FL=1|nr:hypothetical protein [Rickettsiales bacterium]|tara:strand:+ start:1657 stop:2238 length:582 start_codon:yes stop_codon:yes gene_type:complete
MRFAVFPLYLLLAASVLGCQGNSESRTPSCEVSEDLGANEMLATVDGSSWAAQSGGYQIAGAVGFISSFTVDANNLISIRLHHTSTFSFNESSGLVDAEDGPEVAEVFEPGGGPYEFQLGAANREGGDVTLTLDAEVFHTSDADDGGYLYIETVGEGDGPGAAEVRGCFFFDAGTEDGDIASVVDASFAVTSM